jgi:hypothetical protein
VQLNDMAQLLGAKELHSFVAYSLIIYDDAYDTKVDILFADLFQNLLVHYLLMIKLNTRIMRRMHKNKISKTMRQKY